MIFLIVFELHQEKLQTLIILQLLIQHLKPIPGSKDDFLKLEIKSITFKCSDLV